MININKFSEELKCAICLDFFANPRTLKCQHSFCENCLKPLIAKNYFHCPQCRYRNFPNRGLDTFPKNTLLGNLISSISISKAACPQCKTTNSNLTVCEHCSEIFCKECMNMHYNTELKSFEDRIAKMQNSSREIENIKKTIIQEEQTFLKDTVSQMDLLRDKFLSLWSERKLKLVEEIRNFYIKKKSAIKIVHSESKKHEMGLIDMRIAIGMRKLQRNSNDSIDSAITLFKDFSKLDNSLKEIENKLQYSFDAFDLKTIKTNISQSLPKQFNFANGNETKEQSMNYNRPFIFGKENFMENKNPKNQTVEKFKISNEISVNSELEFKGKDFDVAKILQMITSSVYIETKEGSLRKISAILQSNETDNLNQSIKIYDLFGHEVLSLDKIDCEELTIEKLKILISSRLNMDKNCIEFIDKNTSDKLSDPEKLIVNRNSLNIEKYHKNVTSTCNQNVINKFSHNDQKELVELFITFKKYTPSTIKN